MKRLALFLTLFVFWLVPGQASAQPAIQNGGDCEPRLRFSQPPASADPANPHPPGPVGTPRADQGNPDVIRIETELVVAEFDVRDKKGMRVIGLGQADFHVEEDGVPQQIEIFSFGKASARIGRSVILIIDYSHSQLPYIETSIDAAKVLVDMLEPSDRMALVTDDVELLVNFTTDKAVLKEHLDKLKARALSGNYGRSRQLTALFAAVSELFEAGEKRPVVILQTDGDQYPELALWTGRRSDKCAGMAGRYSDLKEVLERAGTTVHTVIPGIRTQTFSNEPFSARASDQLERLLRNETKMRVVNFGTGPQRFSRSFLKAWGRARLRDASAIERISRMTGGISQYLESPDEAGAVYDRILSEMNQRYLLGYYPANTSSDGEKRTIRIKVRDRGDLEINGRSSYTPTRPRPAATNK